MTRPLLIAFLAMGLLVACTSTDTTPPSLAITSPSSGSPVSGTVSVLASASDDVGVSRLDIYARAKGSSSRGIMVGSAVKEPFVVSWNTLAQPNQAELELVAVGRDAGGNEGESPPVAVRTQNSGVPSLQLVTAFTIPPDPNMRAASLDGLPLPVEASEVLPPVGLELRSLPSLELVPQATGERDYILEWQWEPFASGADGYGVYLGSDDLAGPYEVQVRQAASAGAGAQKYSRPLEAQAGDSFHGVVTAITNGATTESGFSNADSATFLPAQEGVSPVEGASVVGGRPTLTWTATPGAVGYLYYIYDRNPWEAGATLLWGNFPQAVSNLNAVYPSEREALPSGDYWWWVAGVSFDGRGKADGFTFSEPRRFVVP